MKKVVMAVVACLVLLSCAGVPKPENQTDSLVIGSIVLDFRDGFFNDPPRRIEAGVRLDFTNLTTQKTFWVITGRGGYFQFLGNGGDRYQISEYAFDVPTGGWGSGSLVYKFTATPHAIQYLGHFEVTYRSPRAGQVTPGETSTEYHFDVLTDHVDRTYDMQTYLAAEPAGAAWVGYETHSEWAAKAERSREPSKTPSILEVVRTGSPQDIQSSIDSGADVMSSDSTGMTPLMYAARDNQDPEVIAVLVKAGADLEARDKYGWTALMLAARRNRNPQVLQSLLDAGADAKAADNNGDTALVHAQQNEQLAGTDALAQLEQASQ